MVSKSDSKVFMSSGLEKTLDDLHVLCVRKPGRCIENVWNIVERMENVCGVIRKYYDVSNDQKAESLE
jgi:hypothetical protein